MAVFTGTQLEVLGRLSRALCLCAEVGISLSPCEVLVGGEKFATFHTPAPDENWPHLTQYPQLMIETGKDS